MLCSFLEDLRHLTDTMPFNIFKGGFKVFFRPLLSVVFLFRLTAAKRILSSESRLWHITVNYKVWRPITRGLAVEMSSCTIQSVTVNDLQSVKPPSHGVTLAKTCRHMESPRSGNSLYMQPFSLLALCKSCH